MIFSKKKRILSAFLSLTMVGTMAASVPFTASAATKAAVSFSVYENNVWKASKNGAAGQGNKGYKVSAVKVKLSGVSGSIVYGLFENKAWKMAKNGAVAGKASKTLSAGEFRATLSGVSGYSVSYSIYENKKWLSGKDNKVVGSASAKIEAIKISITKKAAPVVVKKVSSVSDVADVTVANGTSSDDARAKLPEKVNVTLSDGSTKTGVGVDWTAPSDYDANTAGTYTFTGTLFDIAGVNNDANVTATANVIVSAPAALPTIASVTAVKDVPVDNGTDATAAIAKLPATVDATLSDGTVKTGVAVTWAAPTTYSATTAGTYAFTGTLAAIDGVDNTAKVTATANVVVGAAAPTITSATATATTTVGTIPVISTTVTATLSDGTTKDVTVVWDTISADQVAKVGTFTVNGTIANSTVKAVATVTVNAVPVTITSAATTATTTVGTVPTIPTTISATLSDGTTKDVTVVWDAITPDQVAKAGTFTVNGTIAGSDVKAVATVTVADATITSATAAVSTTTGTVPTISTTVTATLSDGSAKDVTVVWDAITADQVAKAGSFTVNGTIAGSDVKAIATVTVTDATITSVTSAVATTVVGVVPTAASLPATVTATYSDNSIKEVAVTWDTITPEQVAKTGDVTINGKVVGFDKGTTLTLTVNTNAAKLIATKSTLNIGDTTAFTFADSTGAAVTPADVSYSVTSANASTGFLNNGVFTATAAGTYEITATIGTVKLTTSVDVIGSAATVNLTAATSSVSATGSTDKITGTVVDANGKIVSNYNGTVYVYMTPYSNGSLVQPDNSNATGTLAAPIAYTATNGVVTFTMNNSKTSGNDVAYAAVKDSTGAYGAWNKVTVAITDAAVSAIGIASGTPTTLANDGSYVSGGKTLEFDLQDQSGNAILSGNYIGTVTVTGPVVFDNGTQSTVFKVTNGVAHVTIYTTSTTATGTITVTPNVSGLTSVPFTDTLYVAGTASKLALSTTPTSTSFSADVVAGSTSTPFLTYAIQTQDANGYATTTNAPASLASAVVTYNGATSTAISAALSVTSGVFNVALKEISTTAIPAGNYTVTITPVAGADGTTLPAITENFTVTAGAAKTVSVSPSAVTSLTATANSTTISAQLVDAEGNNVATAGTIIDFAGVGVNKLPNGTSANSLAPSLNSYMVSTNASGIATVTATEGTAGAATAGQAGYVTAQIHLSGVTAVPSGDLYIAGSAATKVTVSTASQNYTAGSSTYPSITAYAQTATGVITGDLIDVTMTNPDGTAVTGSITNGGVVAFAAKTSSTITGQNPLNIAAPIAAGTYTFTFSDTSAPNSPTATSTITVIAANASKVAIFNSGSRISSYTATAGTPVELNVAVTDDSGNIVTSPNPVTVQLTSDHSTGKFSLTQGGIPTTTVTIPANTTGTKVYFVDSQDEADALTAASVAAAATATLSTFTTVSTSSPFTYTGYVTVKDQYGNAVTGLSALTITSTQPYSLAIPYITIGTSAGDYKITSTSVDGMYAVTVYGDANLKGATLSISSGSATVSQVLAN
jgi:hypothetical protein